MLKVCFLTFLVCALLSHSVAGADDNSSKRIVSIRELQDCQGGAHSNSEIVVVEDQK